MKTEVTKLVREGRGAFLKPEPQFNYRLVFVMLGLILGLGCSDVAIAANRTLTITSEPSGARVEIDGVYVGVTPLTLDAHCGNSCFSGHYPGWAWTRHLNRAITMTVSKGGYGTKSLSMTEGPYEAINRFGQLNYQYYLYSSDHFDAHLDGTETTSPELAESSPNGRKTQENDGDAIDFRSQSGREESIYWNSVDRTNAEELRLYLQKYPNGRFADLARAKLAKLRGRTDTDAGHQEEGAQQDDRPRLYTDDRLASGGGSQQYAGSPASRSSPRKVTLQIQSTQGSLISDAQRLVAVYCLSRRLVLTQARATMNLTVEVGDQTINFRENGVKNLQVEAAPQSYRISGSDTLVFGTMGQGGSQSTVTVTYTFLGDGTVDLSERDSGQTISLNLTQINSRVVNMDLSSGEGESEITLSLRR